MPAQAPRSGGGNDAAAQKDRRPRAFPARRSNGRAWRLGGPHLGALSRSAGGGDRGRAACGKDYAPQQRANGNADPPRLRWAGMMALGQPVTLKRWANAHYIIWSLRA